MSAQIRSCLALLFIWPILSTADQIDIITDHGIKWDLEPEARIKFNTFLDHERLQLLKAIPSLEFPETFEKSDMARFFSADSSKYRNRRVACSFLTKMRKGLKLKERDELDTLTRKGKVCIQADLDPSQQHA